MANDPLGTYADAIASIESGGRYNLVGPRDARYGRALGRYQVMEGNLPDWLREAGLPSMTAEQFLASPESQDTVFRHRFGQYVDRYGPEGAAAAWFAGEGGMNNPDARDSLNTSVAEYRRRFNAALNGGDATASAATPGTPSTSDASAGGGVFGSLFGGNSSGSSQVGIDGVPVEDLMRHRRALDTNMAASDAPKLSAPRLPQLDLTRLRALLQNRGRLGSMTG
jgi:hypothetical protein